MPLGIEGNGWGFGEGMKGKKEYERLEDRKNWGSDGAKAFSLGVRESDVSFPLS